MKLKHFLQHYLQIQNHFKYIIQKNAFQTKNQRGVSSIDCLLYGERGTTCYTYMYLKNTAMQCDIKGLKMRY